MSEQNKQKYPTSDWLITILQQIIGNAQDQGKTYEETTKYLTKLRTLRSMYLTYFHEENES